MIKQITLTALILFATNIANGQRLMDVLSGNNKDLPCEKLVAENSDKEINVEIAKYCKKMWETNEALDFSGSPKGTYVRHTYSGEQPILKDDLGNITGMGIYANVVVLLKDGKCKVARVKFIKQYQGGGSYGKLSNPFVFGDYFKIDCACADKLTDWLSEGKKEQVVVESNTRTETKNTSENTDTKKTTNSSKNKSSTTNVDKFKKADGPYEKKDENGQIEQSGTYKNQKKQGLWKSFENGKLYLEENYVDDVKNGLETKYNDDGGINYKIEFKAGEKNGAEQLFENSKLKSNNTYVSGKKNGKCTSYYSEGGKYSEENYVDGKLEGVKTQYTAKGEISSTTTYKDDKKNGPFKDYSDGKIKEEGTYLNGMQDGVWKKYDKTGKVTDTKTYKDGVPQ